MITGGDGKIEPFLVNGTDGHQIYLPWVTDYFQRWLVSRDQETFDTDQVSYG